MPMNATMYWHLCINFMPLFGFLTDVFDIHYKLFLTFNTGRQCDVRVATR